ncbi:MAG: asparagine synthase [Proteobacteria bacterium]|nr:asparagine synthase [Pseudomonadota bacterium]
MSGLTGAFAFSGAGLPPDTGRRMAERSGHRGRGRIGGVLRPRDGLELWQIGPGRPASSPAACLVMDGAIYNRQELCERLGRPNPADGPGLVLALYESEGVDGLARINGDLALALYDRLKDRLILFRDRFGVKPLYYARAGSTWLFASEIKSLFQHPALTAEPDPGTLFDYLATHYRYIHRDPARTYYDGVRQVPPGHYVVLGPSGDPVRRYWKLELDPEAAALDSRQAEERLLDLVRDSVARRLNDERPMAFSVSSGMDSSSVCSLASILTGEKLDLYSVGYGRGEYDESEGIAPLADRYAARWRNILISEPPLLDLVDRLVRLTDGPVCTVTWLSHYFLARTAREDGRHIIFSGLGGDECLAGEYEHFLFFFADLKRKGLDDRLALEVEGWSRLHDHPIFKKSWAVVEDALNRLVDLTRPGLVLPDRLRYERYLDHFDPDFIQAGDRPLEMVCPYDSYLANRCYQDLFFETTPPCLAADDKNVARFGLETRFPFLDHRVVEFCYSLPGEIKYDRGVTKAVMRRAMKGILPEANRLNTTKTGFNAPVGEWIMGPGRDKVWDLIRSRSFRERGWFRPGAAEQLFMAHEWGEANHMMLLWQILNAELWLRSLTEQKRKAA